jgi:peptidylprolyl isomerase
MDRRVLTLIVALGLTVALVAGIVIARSGGSDDGGSGDLTDLSTKPSIEPPDSAPPEELVKRDIVTGEGAEAKEGDNLKVEYVGVVYANGKEFDSSWGREPFTFQLGSGSVIPGWDQGVAGMRVGGRRELTIPPDLAYGPQGSPPAIPPNATLIFVIDLLSVN